jgi:DNA-binding response OmpR family regulator
MPLVVCPCCSGVGTVDDAAGVHLTPMERRLFEIVSEHDYNGISGRDLADAFYSDRINGGPDHAENSVRVQIHRANRKLAAVGRRITATAPGVGGAYRVVPL